MKFTTLLALLCLFLAGCKGGEAAHADEHGHEEEAGHTESVELNADQLKLAGVEVLAVRRMQIQGSLEVPGIVNSTAKGRAVVTPPAAGRIVSLKVALGDHVKRGQTLAILESPELASSWSSIADSRQARDAAAASLREANSEVGLAEAKLKSAKTNLTRQRALAKAGAFSQAPLQQAQSDLNEAQSELLSIQKEQVSHADQFRRLENLFKEGIVSKSDLEAARLELLQDEIRLNRTKARIEIAKATYDREKNIAGRGLNDSKELHAAESEARLAELEVQKAKIQVRSAQAGLANANKAISNAQAVYRSNTGTGGASVGQVALVAPIAGTVTHLDITLGQAVDRTTTVMEVENLDSVWVTANIPERDAAKVRKGAFVKVIVPALPDKEFEGIVHLVSARVDPKTRAIAVECLVTGANGALKPDMFASVQMGVGTSVSELVIPSSALVKEGKETFVFVKEGEAFEKREVEVGPKSGDSVAILKGLKDGEMVAVKGAFVLASEQKKDELKGHEH